MKLFILLGSLNATLVVMLGAFGAHGLKARLSQEMLAVFQTGVQYHFYHALGLFAVAFVASQFPDSTLVKWSGWTMLAGIVLFSGSLYILSLSGIRWLGAITPLGGLAFIVAWCLLAIAVVKN
ncbi:MAG: DUF423 domain-containing protein [Gammaproteobacteria bacterium]|nr:DUF423 domain-containing protein [Gammaproteobacteria bacterium]